MGLMAGTRTEVVQPVEPIPGVQQALWVVVERIVLKSSPSAAPDALYARKKGARDIISVRGGAWSESLGLKIRRSTGKVLPGVWVTPCEERAFVRLHASPGVQVLTFIANRDKRRAPHGRIYRVSVFYEEHFARCYYQGKNPGKGRDGDTL